MGCGKSSSPVMAQNKMDQYTVPTSDNEKAAEAPQAMAPPHSTVDLNKILKVTEISREAVETKANGLRVDLSLLHHDL
ncbi:hypothetical protein NDU88_002088 [Pleurodeles waltl]|uniref:Uncharacterized protein n=1 Tax=Pleurodeles waltl TaxID=8319 RepID=A0AAV7TK63_PLEWA|nr:hypothetical protein NDU88_002088 [Pleurodeles waltl]